MKTLFDEKNHIYYVDDKEVSSVTKICEPISFKRLDALNKSLLERARKRGSRVHELCEEFLLIGELDWDFVETEYIPYLQQFILWVKTYRPKILYTELKMFSREFCGTCDLIIELDGKIILVDYKTSSAVDKKSLSVQFEGYKRLCEMSKTKIDECWYLHLKKESFVFKKINPNKKWFNILLEHNKFMKTNYKENNNE